MYQSLAWQLSVALVLVLLAVFAYVAWNAGEKSDDAAIQRTSSRLRTAVFWALVIVFIPVIGYTLSELPYSAPAGRAGSPQVIKAVAHQWRWELSGTGAVVGQPVEFHVTAADVNHGFGLYDPDLKLVTQTQAMPGYVNVLHYTFTRPGTYKVLCLEYCGLGHHGMMAEITVAEAK